MAAIKFDQSNPSCVDGTGMSFETVCRLLLGPNQLSQPRLAGAAENYIKQFIIREHRACEQTYGALSAASARSSFIAETRPSTGHIPIFEACDGFYLGYLGLTGRVTHIVIPDTQSVIYDLDPSSAPYALETCHNIPTEEFGDRRIGIVDMPINFAHQAMNNLSGIQRLIDSGSHRYLDEIRVVGREFYGDTRLIFPELADKITHGTRAEITPGRGQFFKIGSNVMSVALRNRIVRHALRRYPFETVDRSPIVAFTVRGDGRRCLNLPHVIRDVTERLLPKYPNMGLVLDGWCLPESEGRSHQIENEGKLFRDILSVLPTRLIVKSLLGESILKSISALQCVDAYVAHIGTPQHKLGWFSSATGIVHGPTAPLSAIDSSAFATEIGFPPEYISKDVIQDSPVDTPRGRGFYDYMVLDTTGISGSLDKMLSGVTK
jgi:hypothetical protein